MILKAIKDREVKRDFLKLTGVLGTILLGNVGAFAQTKRISVATGGMGVYFVIEGIASILTKYELRQLQGYSSLGEL